MNQAKAPRGENSDPSLSLSPLPPTPLNHSCPPLTIKLMTLFMAKQEDVTEGTRPRPVAQHRSSLVTWAERVEAGRRGTGRGGTKQVVLGRTGKALNLLLCRMMVQVDDGSELPSYFVDNWRLIVTVVVAATMAVRSGGALSCVVDLC